MPRSTTSDSLRKTGSGRPGRPEPVPGPEPLSDVELLLAEGHCLCTVGRHDDATSAYRRAVELAPSSGDAWWSLANMKTYDFSAADRDVMREQLGVCSVDDDKIRESLRQDFAEFGFATCPHTATATWTWRHLDTDVAESADWILVATAHPAKFETIVEPLIGEPVPVPPELAELLERPARVTAIEPSLAALATVLA